MDEWKPFWQNSKSIAAGKQTARERVQESVVQISIHWCTKVHSDQWTPHRLGQQNLCSLLPAGHDTFSGPLIEWKFERLHWAQRQKEPVPLFLLLFEASKNTFVSIRAQLGPAATALEGLVEVSRALCQQLVLHLRIGHVSHYNLSGSEITKNPWVEIRCYSEPTHVMALHANSCESNRPCSIGLVIMHHASGSHNVQSSSTLINMQAACATSKTFQNQIIMEWHIPETPGSAWHWVSQFISGLNPAREECRVMLMLALMALKSCEPSVHKCDCVLKAGYICIFSIEVSILENVAFERLGVKECSAGHIFILALTFFPFTQHPECISTFAAWWAVGAVNLHELTLWYVWEASCKTIHHCPKLLQQSTKLFVHSFCVLF